MSLKNKEKNPGNLEKKTAPATNHRLGYPGKEWQSAPVFNAQIPGQGRWITKRQV